MVSEKLWVLLRSTRTIGDDDDDDVCIFHKTVRKKFEFFYHKNGKLRH